MRGKRECQSQQELRLHGSVRATSSHALLDTIQHPSLVEKKKGTQGTCTGETKEHEECVCHSTILADSTRQTRRDSISPSQRPAARADHSLLSSLEYLSTPNCEKMVHLHNVCLEGQLALQRKGCVAPGSIPGNAVSFPPWFSFQAHHVPSVAFDDQICLLSRLPQARTRPRGHQAPKCVAYRDTRRSRAGCRTGFLRNSSGLSRCDAMPATWNMKCSLRLSS